jgi:hypothetical protein
MLVPRRGSGLDIGSCITRLSEAFPAGKKAALDAAFFGYEVSEKIYYPLLSEHQVQL